MIWWLAVLISSKNRKLRVSDFFIFVFSNNPELLLYWKINSFSTDMVHFTRCFSVFVNFCHFENQLIFSNIWTYTRKFSPHEIPHLPDLSHFTRFVNKTRFVNTFFGNENVTNRVSGGFQKTKWKISFLIFKFKKRKCYQVLHFGSMFKENQWIFFAKSSCHQKSDIFVRSKSVSLLWVCTTLVKLR